MEAVREERFYTIEDIEALPMGERAELIDGQLYSMAPPGRGHQRLLGFIYRKISDQIDSQGGECEVNIAPFGVFLNQDQYNYVEPDLSVVCDPSKLDERGCHGAPDWVIEIVSPGSRTMDYVKKLFKYQNAGVREYWIVDPMKRRTLVYRFEQLTMDEYAFEEEIPTEMCGGFVVRLPERTDKPPGQTVKTVL